MKSIIFHPSFLCQAFCLLFVFPILHSQKVTDSSDYYRNIILNLSENEHLEKTFHFYKDRIENNLNKGDTLYAVYDIRLLAIGQLEMGALSDSEAMAIKALNLLEELPNISEVKECKRGIYNHIGLIHRHEKNYATAILYYQDALKLVSETKDSINVMLNIANIYKDQKLYNKAIQQYNLIYDKGIKQNNRFTQARALDNMGFTKSLINESTAIADLRSALKIRSSENDIRGLYSSYFHLSEYFKGENQSDSSLFYANKAYALAKKIGSTSYIENSLTQLLKLSKDSLTLKFIKLNDSINTSRLNIQNKYASMKYNIEEERQKTHEIQLLQEKEKRQKITYLYSGISILILSLFTYFLLRIKHKKDKLLEVYNTETRISKKVHDEVANDVYHVMTKLQSKTDINDDVLDDLEGIYVKTRDISKDNSAIDLDGNFDELLNDLLLSYKNKDVNIITKHLSKINWNLISNIKKTTIYRVLQELMTNMRKHSQASIVVVAFNIDNNKLLIEYTDNGIGCDIKKHNGLQNVETRIASIKGTITFESEINNGFKAKIKV